MSITIFTKFCKDRNIKDSTKQGYVSTLIRYTNLQNCTIEELIKDAEDDEKNRIPLKERRIKERMLKYRTYLLESDLSSNTVKTYFSKLKTFYTHYEIEIPYLPDVKYNKGYVTNYPNLPSKQHIRDALELEQDDIVPTIYLKRIKTDKYYYTSCSSEASTYIIKYLKTRENLKLKDKLFPFNGSYIMKKFQIINDQMEWGFKGNYRFFRTHILRNTLRKFHASNIQLIAEYIDALQGRSKNSVHETYIKTNPDKLKQIYIKNMKNVIIYNKEPKKTRNKRRYTYNNQCLLIRQTNKLILKTKNMN